jgi:hypothetical protein
LFSRRWWAQNARTSLYRALEEPRWRNLLLAFLIAGPVVFRIFGALLG